MLTLSKETKVVVDNEVTRLKRVITNLRASLATAEKQLEALTEIKKGLNNGE